MPDWSLEMVREIALPGANAARLAQAVELLNQLPGVGASLRRDGRCLVVRYHVLEHSLEELEDALLEQHFALDARLATTLRRAMVHYAEAVERQGGAGVPWSVAPQPTVAQPPHVHPR